MNTLLKRCCGAWLTALGWLLLAAGVAQAAPVRLDHEGLEIVERAVVGVHVLVIGDVVAIVTLG